jgi:hypothetical protein
VAARWVSSQPWSWLPASSARAEPVFGRDLLGSADRVNKCGAGGTRAAGQRAGGTGAVNKCGWLRKGRGRLSHQPPRPTQHGPKRNARYMNESSQAGDFDGTPALAGRGRSVAARVVPCRQVLSGRESPSLMPTGLAKPPAPLLRRRSGARLPRAGRTGPAGARSSRAVSRRYAERGRDLLGRLVVAEPAQGCADPAVIGSPARGPLLTG